jgi:pyridoxal phosphate phosphatase PHOSPHO2
MVRGVKDLKAAKAAETTFLCLSNSNSVFISTILEDKGLQNLFTEVITNPAKWEPSGMLNLRRRVDPFGPQHKCKVGCSPNMCKGEELEAFLAKQSYTYDRIIFVGDGSNDFCPILRLRDKDLCLCRSFRGLQKRIEKEGEQQGLKCKIQYWAGAWEVEEIFQNLPKIPT